MSKVGTKKIVIEEGVMIEVNGNRAVISGPLGKMEIDCPDNLKIRKQDKEIIIERKFEDKKTKSIHGLYRQLVANAAAGVKKSWEKRLEVVGTGFNAKLQGEDLVFKIGYSHPVVFKKQAGVSYKVEGNNKIVVSGIDKQLVGQVAYQIKLIRKPDVYKGKGIKFENEKLRIKPGKKAKAAGAAA